MRIRLNPNLVGLQCISCAREYEVAHFPRGCPSCFEAGAPSNMRCAYRTLDTPASLVPLVDPITLGSGRTPLLRLPDSLGLGPGVWAKDESRNPTGSHKDRFSLGAVGWAYLAGFDTIVAASSGNAALSLSAFSAAYGLGCVIAMSKSVVGPIPGHVRALGAHIEIFETDDQRWEYVADRCADGKDFNATNFAVPVVGSSPFGIQYFKEIAYEIAASECTPDALIVPSSRGDLAFGIYQGFVDLGKPVPRLYLVEPFPRLEAVLDSGVDWRTAFPGETGNLVSIGGDTTTQQSIAAAVGSGGGAVAVDHSKAAARHQRMWEHGYCWEVSSNSGFAALEYLQQQGQVYPSETAIVIATSHGFKGL